jgi:hypothetical protein
MHNKPGRPPKILDFNVHFIRKANSDNFANELSHDIEAKLVSLDDMEGLPYEKPDMMQLISSLEVYKMRCLKGEISAKRLYRDWEAHSLSRSTSADVMLIGQGMQHQSHPAHNI